jgi:hypothetical protein
MQDFKQMNRCVPLTQEQIIELWTSTGSSLNPEQFEKLVRVVEDAHSIKL